VLRLGKGCILSLQCETKYPGYKVTYQAFFGVLIDLIIDLLGLIIKTSDNQTKIWV
jgi:hypothetical protein